MSVLNEHKAVKTNNDMQNVITCEILRQNGEFIEADVFARIMSALTGSAFEEKAAAVLEQYRATLNWLDANGYLERSDNGKAAMKKGLPNITVG